MAAEGGTGGGQGQGWGDRVRDGGTGTGVAVSHDLTVQLLTPHMHIYRHGVEHSPPGFYFVFYDSVSYLQGWNIALHCHMHAFTNTHDQRRPSSHAEHTPCV